MGAEVLVPLAITALGTGAAAYNQNRALRRADQIAAQGIRQQGMRQREADSRVDAEIADLAGSNAERDRQAANDQYMQQIQRTRRAAAGGQPDAIGASSRYSEDIAAGDQQIASTGQRVADLLARTNAPIMQREREQQGFGRLASDIGTIGRAASGDAFLNQLRVNGVRPNPWVDAAAQIAQGYARARAGRAGYGSRSPSNVDDILGAGGGTGAPPLPGYQWDRPAVGWPVVLS